MKTHLISKLTTTVFMSMKVAVDIKSVIIQHIILTRYGHVLLEIFVVHTRQISCIISFAKGENVI